MDCTPANIQSFRIGFLPLPTHVQHNLIAESLLDFKTWFLVWQALWIVGI